MSSKITYELNEKGIVFINFSFDKGVSIDHFTKMLQAINGGKTVEIMVKALSNHALNNREDIQQVSEILNTIGKVEVTKKRGPVIKPRDVLARYSGHRVEPSEE